MSFEDARDDETVVTYSEAQAELKRHNFYMTQGEFYAAFGVEDMYKAKDILFYLGY